MAAQERTGKVHKAVQLIGGALMIAGVGGCVASTAEHPEYSLLGLFGFVLGAVIYFAGRISAWWAHG